MSHEVNQDLGSALAVVLQHLDKEVKAIIEEALTSDAGADVEYPLILDHFILRKHADAYAPCLKKIIGQIKSSEHMARRALDSNEASTLAGAASDHDNSRNPNESTLPNEAEATVVDNGPHMTEEDIVMVEDAQDKDSEDSEDPSSNPCYTCRLRARTGLAVASAPPRPFVCPFCDRKMATKQTLTNHINLHTGNKRMFIPLFIYIFYNVHNSLTLILNLDVHCVRDLAFKCKYPGCDAAFSHDHYLRVHKLHHKRTSKNMKVDPDNKASIARPTDKISCSGMSASTVIVKTEPELSSPDLRATTFYPSPNLSPVTSTFITPPYSYSSPFGPARPLQSIPALSISGGEGN